MLIIFFSLFMSSSPPFLLDTGHCAQWTMGQRSFDILLSLDSLFGADQELLRCRKCFFHTRSGSVCFLSLLSLRPCMVPSISFVKLCWESKCHKPAETPVLFCSPSASQRWQRSLSEKVKPCEILWCLHGILDSSTRRESLRGSQSLRAQEYQLQLPALITLAWALTPAK